MVNVGRSGVDVVTIPCLKDNFAYLLICEASGEAAVVDPSEAAPVLRACETHGVTLTAILNTHHHWDHVGGNQELIGRFPEVAVYGFHTDMGRIPGQTVALRETDNVVFGKVRGKITHNPGHTAGAITYYFGNKAFTGDTLFAAGCGRLFEGTADQMYQSLNHSIGSHAPETLLYFGHEYTQSNLSFAASVEPENRAITQRAKEVRALRREGLFTTPTTLELERKTNPFMRCDSPALVAIAQAEGKGQDPSGAEVLAVIRKRKDRF